MIFRSFKIYPGFLVPLRISSETTDLRKTLQLPPGHFIHFQDLPNSMLQNLVHSPKKVLIDPGSGWKDLGVTECWWGMMNVVYGPKKILVELGSHLKWHGGC
jgi:hypothetical protein